MGNVKLEREKNYVVVTIDRPKALNALNSQVLTELDDALEQIKKDEEIYVVILTGAGEKAFAAGADIAEMKDMSVMEARKFSMLGNSIFRKLEMLEKPVIAAVNGFALGGGCELILACDIRIASDKAKFGQPEVGLGITPGFGGTQRLARTVGLGAAKELIYTGKIIDAQEAYRIGLVNRVVEPDKLMEEARALAVSIAANSPIAVKLSKTAINRGIQMDIDTAVMYEADVFAESFSTEDQREGMGAFLEKRVKSFKNK